MKPVQLSSVRRRKKQKGMLIYYNSFTIARAMHISQIKEVIIYI